MKKIFFLVAVLAVAGTILSSCEREPISSGIPAIPEVSETGFTTVERVPLNEGNPVTGEAGILNPVTLRSGNIPLLKPVMTRIWDEVVAGQYETSPIEGVFPAGTDPRTFLGWVLRSMERQVLPNRNICRVRIADLQGHQVTTPRGSVSLADYLSARNYESYPINLTTGHGTARVRTYEEAREMQVITAQGERDQLTYY